MSKKLQSHKIVIMDLTEIPKRYIMGIDPYKKEELKDILGSGGIKFKGSKHDTKK